MILPDILPVHMLQVVVYLSISATAAVQITISLSLSPVLGNRPVYDETDDCS